MNTEGKWVGKTQRKILSALSGGPMTRLELINCAGASNSATINALYALEYKGLVLRDGKKYQIAQ